MLPQKPEAIEKMKARFPAALAEKVDINVVLANPALAPSKNRKHVFDFADGMRLIASTDICGKESVVHISISGDEHYAKSINNSVEEFNEDVWLRLAALLGAQPPEAIRHFISNKTVLHLFFQPHQFVIRDQSVTSLK
jgi:hypothetical protein